MIDEYYTFKIFGYHSDDLKSHSRKRIIAACDECYVYRALPLGWYNDICKKCTDKYRGAAISKTKLMQKVPLPDGMHSKLCDITDNKECSTYLGSIAETILSNMYNDVRVMPYGNHGFDIICNRDFMIDIKSSATGDKLGYWTFRIKQNQMADYFLCIAFNNRDDLYNPAHLWMIPGRDVNHLTGLQISKTTVDKWCKYELSLDKLLSCCNNMRG